MIFLNKFDIKKKNSLNNLFFKKKLFWYDYYVFYMRFSFIVLAKNKKYNEIKIYGRGGRIEFLRKSFRYLLVFYNK